MSSTNHPASKERNTERSNKYQCNPISVFSIEYRYLDHRSNIKAVIDAAIDIAMAHPPPTISLDLIFDTQVMDQVTTRLKSGFRPG